MLNIYDELDGLDSVFGLESFNTALLDMPQNNEEVSTEVGEDGQVHARPDNAPQNPKAPQQPKGPVVIQSRCPLVITHVMIDGQMYTRVDSYIRGSIDDIEGYVPLIDCLNRADDKWLFNLHIQSGGGMVTTGATIASSIANCKGRVTTIAEGLCASAASLIWSAGHVCEVTDYAMFMYHMSSHADMNNSQFIAESALTMVNYVKKCLMRNALRNGHITQEDYVKFCENKEEVWISAADMRSRIAAHKQATMEV